MVIIASKLFIDYILLFVRCLHSPASCTMGMIVGTRSAFNHLKYTIDQEISFTVSTNHKNR